MLGRTCPGKMGEGQAGEVEYLEIRHFNYFFVFVLSFLILQDEEDRPPAYVAPKSFQLPFLVIDPVNHSIPSQTILYAFIFL